MQHIYLTSAFTFPTDRNHIVMCQKRLVIISLLEAHFPKSSLRTAYSLLLNGAQRGYAAYIIVVPMGTA